MDLALLPVKGSTASHILRPPRFRVGSFLTCRLPAFLFQARRLPPLLIRLDPRAIILPSGFALRRQSRKVVPVLECLLKCFVAH